jgi:hypothetical protein
MPGQLKGDLVALISDSWFIVWQCAAMVIVGQTAAAKSSPKSETKKDLVSLSFFFFCTGQRDLGVLLVSAWSTSAPALGVDISRTIFSLLPVAQFRI